MKDDEIELQRIQNHLGDMNRVQDHEGLNLESLLDQVDPHFTDEIMREEVPPKFKLLVIKVYDCLKDPMEHLDTF